ncbi:MAG TPA: alcohol dehydrogenase catalytic domain-containing protein, partial [Acidimicrobiia bacterium]|nr:alcohol dehydrogenase catalytic domain-containing protein [Acidimicrobiia bacterium]
MKTSAAVLFSQPGKWEVTEVDLDEPEPSEVLVKMVAAGLCHSDDHMVTGDMPSMKLPMAGGHEGAGVVEAVGSNVTNVAPGDHVVLQFIPGCGRCRWCASGQQNLCDTGAMLLAGTQLDGTFRMHKDGQDVGQAFSAIRKAGTVAVTGVGNVTAVGIPVSLFELTMYQKRIQGVLYGSLSPSKDMLRLL